MKTTISFLTQDETTRLLAALLLLFLAAPHDAGAQFLLDEGKEVLAEPLLALLVGIAHQGSEESGATDRAPGKVFRVLAEALEAFVHVRGKRNRTGKEGGPR